jgi:hypothetical protein
MSPGGRQTLVDRYNKKNPKGGQPKSPYLGTSQQNTFQTTFEATKSHGGKYKDQYTRSSFADPAHRSAGADDLRRQERQVPART